MNLPFKTNIVNYVLFGTRDECAFLEGWFCSFSIFLDNDQLNTGTEDQQVGSIW